MSKSTIQYWNTLASMSKNQWDTIEGSNGDLERPYLGRLHTFNAI
jgi:hypothetical protein